MSTEPEPWRIEITRTAQRDLRRLDPPVRQRLADALRVLAVDPHRAGQLRKLTGVAHRNRGSGVGDWRALWFSLVKPVKRFWSTH